LQALRRGLDTETARCLHQPDDGDDEQDAWQLSGENHADDHPVDERRHRALCGLVGLLMLVI
jgi:hypothetical protein